MTIAKIIKLVGSSEKSWSEAAQQALDEAKKRIEGITGLEVNEITARVDPSSGKIKEYKVGVKIAFGVEHSETKFPLFSVHLCIIVLTLLVVEDLSTNMRKMLKLDGWEQCTMDWK
jgi:dodecin